MTVNNTFPVTLIVTLFYPSKLRKIFLEELGELLSEITTDYNSIIITGDFNIHAESVSYVTKQFLEVVASFDFKQLVCCSIHKSCHILDLVLTKDFNVVVTPVVDVGISDHVCATLFT